MFFVLVATSGEGADDPTVGFGFLVMRYPISSLYWRVVGSMRRHGAWIDE